MTEQTPAAESTPQPESPNRRGLPFGPFGMLVVTAVALVVAGLAVWGVVTVLSPEKKSEAVDVKDALDDVTFTPPADSKKVVNIGDKVPDVPLKLINGKSTTLGEVTAKGKPVVLNFWASTCVPCLKEMPALESVNAEIGDKVMFMGINAQDTVESAKEMIDKTGVTFDSARDPRGEISTMFAAHALPRTVLVDKKGKIVDTHTGELSRAKLIKLLSDNNFPVP